MPGGGTDPYMELPRLLELGRLVDKLTGLFLECNCDWVSFVHRVCTRPCLHENVKSLPHSAAANLHDLRADGAPIQCTTTMLAPKRKDRYMQRGPHPSTRPYLHFLKLDMADMITKGYWVVLPYDLVKGIPNLHISPMGAITQRERRPRTLVKCPPYFCTTMETIVVLANLYSHSSWDPPSHPLKDPSATVAPWDGHLTIMVPLPNLQANQQPKTGVMLRPPTWLQ